MSESVPSERWIARRGNFLRGSFDFRVLRDYGIVVGTAVLFIALSLSAPAFLTKQNFLNLLDQNAPLGIIACAMTIVIIAGGFDLSVGAIFALSGVVAAIVANHSSTTLGFLTALAAGLAMGLGNGILVAGLRINAFIATLASSLVIGGAAALITQGNLVTVLDPSFSKLGLGTLGTVPYSIFVWGGFAAISGFALSRTLFGRYVYAVGGHSETARLSGVRVGRIRVMTFAATGLAAALAGIINVSQISTARADTGDTLPLSAIAAVAIGGTSILGGEGAMWRTILGVILLAFINNGFDLLALDPFFRSLTEGAIIIAAVAFDSLARRQR